MSIIEDLEGCGALQSSDVERARRAAEQTGERLDRLLPKLGMIDDEQMARTLSRALNLPLLGRKSFPDRPAAIGDVPAAFLHKHQILPVEDDGGVLMVVVVDPLNRFPIDSLRFRLDRDINLAVGTPADIEHGLSRLHPIEESDPAKGLAIEQGDSDNVDLERLKDQASDAPVIQWVNALIADSIEARSSDIHLEPHENGLRVRRRVDGALQERPSPPQEIAVAVASRIKVMAKLDIAERRMPQDGRCSITVRGRDIDLRVATAPSLRGEAVVLRILDRNRAALDLDKLGYAPKAATQVRELLAEPNGIILVTGPTGSGKTTTLYAALTELVAPDRKIMSVEDPVEYELEGVAQIQMKPAIGLTFARALRSILRHDPDIIMVGEIRDRETAEIAIEAALTGHLVLSTLHTNSAAAAVTRLREMELPDYLLAATLRGVVAQRLVRRLCPACRKPSPKAMGIVEAISNVAEGTAYEFSGCSECNGSGYRGRACIAEILPLTQALRREMLHGADEQALSDLGAQNGMTRLIDDGVAKVLDGVTSIDEVLKVASAS